MFHFPLPKLSFIFATSIGFTRFDLHKYLTVCFTYLASSACICSYLIVSCLYLLVSTTCIYLCTPTSHRGREIGVLNMGGSYTALTMLCNCGCVELSGLEPSAPILILCWLHFCIKKLTLLTVILLYVWEPASPQIGLDFVCHSLLMIDTVFGSLTDCFNPFYILFVKVLGTNEFPKICSLQFSSKMSKLNILFFLKASLKLYIQTLIPVSQFQKYC